MTFVDMPAPDDNDSMRRGGQTSGATVVDAIVENIRTLIGNTATPADVAALQSEIDTLNQQGTSVRQPSGAQLVGGTIPAGSAILQEVGDGHDRWVAASVVLDDTKRTAWAAQAAANPYALPAITSSNTLPSATNGTAGYTFTFTCTSDLGGGALTWSIASGGTDATHIAGLALNQSTGALTGTPSSAGTFLFVIQVIDEIGGYTTMVCTLTVAATSTPGFVLPAAPSVQPVANSAYTFDPRPYQTPTLSGTLTWSSPSLPNHHLSINSSTGVISGTPLTADAGSSFNVTVSVTNGTTTLTSHTQFTIASAPGALAITLAAMPEMTQGTAITTTQVTTSGGSGVIASGSISAGTLPAGLTLTVGFGIATISGTPTGSGAYDFTVSLTDTSGTPQTATHQYTGTIAVSTTPFNWFGGAAQFDLGTLFPAGSPKVGDAVSIALSQFATNATGTPIYDSKNGSGQPTTPADKLDVNNPTGFYGGTPSTATTVNPILRASNDGGATWLATQCHLQVYSATPSVNIDTAIVNAGGQIDSVTGTLTGSSGRTKAATNLAAVLSAIASAKSNGYELATSAGSYANPIFVGLSRSAFGGFLTFGSSGTPWATAIHLGSVIFYLVDGQPTNSAPLQFATLYPVDGLDWSLRVDIRGGSQAAPPAAGSGAAGFYNHGILVLASANTNYRAEIYNGVGVTGSSSGGTSETFDMKFGQDGGGHSGSCVMLGQWEGDTGTHYASGMVVQQSPETAAAHAPRGWVTLTGDKRRHLFGEFAGGPWGIDNGSTGSNTPRGFYIEGGSPNSGCIASPSLYIGRPGVTANPPTTTNCGSAGGTTGAVGTTYSGGTEPGELVVNSHRSISDIYAPYVTQGTTAASPSVTIANSVITGAPGKCIQGLGGAHTATQNLAKVSVDHATCTVAGLGSNNQVAPNVPLASGSWTKLS